jgi:hypothetical protein
VATTFFHILPQCLTSLQPLKRKSYCVSRRRSVCVQAFRNHFHPRTHSSILLDPVFPGLSSPSKPLSRVPLGDHFDPTVQIHNPSHSLPSPPSRLVATSPSPPSSPYHLCSVLAPETAQLTAAHVDTSHVMYSCMFPPNSAVQLPGRDRSSSRPSVLHLVGLEGVILYHGDRSIGLDSGAHTEREGRPMQCKMLTIYVCIYLQQSRTSLSTTTSSASPSPPRLLIKSEEDPHRCSDDSDVMCPVPVPVP